MRGGSSRGPYMNRADLPDDLDHLARVLIAAVGSGHPQNIDGIGGGSAVTTKVAMLSRSQEEWADIDYFFAQVSVEDQLVDFKPTCGNILTGVGPAALEMGLIEPTGAVTEVRIRAVNTGARIMARVQTPAVPFNMMAMPPSTVFRERRRRSNSISWMLPARRPARSSRQAI